MSGVHEMPRAEVLQFLRRAGYPSERIEAIKAALPDPVDFDRDATLMTRLGLTRDHLMDLMGGSP